MRIRPSSPLSSLLSTVAHLGHMSAAALSLPVSEKVRIRTATVPVESNGGVGEGGGPQFINLSSPP